MWKKRLIKFTKWFLGIILGLFLLITFLLWYYKDDICQAVIGEMNEYLATEMEVSDVDLAFWGSFPNLSVDLNNVFVKDAIPGATRQDTLLHTKRIRLKFNPLDIWRENYTVKEIEVSPGTLKLKVKEDGQVNYDIFKPKEDSTSESAVDLKLEAIHLKGFRVSYENEVTDQYYSTNLKSMSLNGALSESVFTTTASSHMTIIEARSGEVSLIHNQPAKLDISVEVNQDSNNVIIPKSTIYVSNLPFHFEGAVRDSTYDFELKANNISIEDFANHFSMNQVQQVKQFKGNGQLLFDLGVHGISSNDQAAKIRCDFGVEKGYLTDPSSGFAIRDMHVNGYYSNEQGPEKEILSLDQLSFNTKGGTFNGTVQITEFDAPLIEGKSDGLLDLSIVHSLLHIPHVKTLKGTVDLYADFIVRQEPQADGSSLFNVNKCDGHVDLHDISTQMIDDKRLFKNINGEIFLRNEEAGIKDISVQVGKSSLKINGVFREVVDYFRDEGNLDVDVDVVSSFISLNDLGTEEKDVKQHNERAYILPKNVSGELYLDVARMDYEKHKFFNIKGNMTLENRKIHFPKLSVRNGGANGVGSLTIEETRPEYFYIKSQLVSKNIKFQPLFKEWDNFEQTVIKSNNIHGTAQANIAFEAPFDMRGGIVMKQIKSTIGLQIDDGKLVNVSTFKTITESLKETSAKQIIGKENIEILEKKLMNLSFDQMTNTVVIKNGVVVIPKMHIANSALDIDLSGTHTFTNIIDYRFEFRFRDLRQPEQSEFGIIEDDGTGIHVFMRMYGNLYDPNIEWDKEAKKEAAKERRAQEKAEIKSILKSEFGFFRNDTTVTDYHPQQKSKDEIILITDPLEEIDEIHEEKKPKRDTKFRRTLNKWKNEKEAEKEEEMDFDFD